MSAASVMDSMALFHKAGPGSNPRAALHPQAQVTPKEIVIKPISHSITRQICIKKHYLHSYPGGSVLNFGIFASEHLLGVAVLGVGPANLHCLFRDAQGHQVLCLSRLWLSDKLPHNSESRFIGVVLRSLKKYSGLKFLVSYADPTQGHLGTIYQATGWLYTGLSQATPLYDVGDGKARHSRSLSHAFGTHSLEHFSCHGIQVKLVPQQAKHRYVYFLDPAWREMLRVPALPYPKLEVPDADG